MAGRRAGQTGAAAVIIAGAGSGKTHTLAHRVAHLIANGADPRRILLMTFSRRAASEMIGRVERIGGRVMGDKVRIPGRAAFRRGSTAHCRESPRPAAWSSPG